MYILVSNMGMVNSSHGYGKALSSPGYTCLSCLDAGPFYSLDTKAVTHPGTNRDQRRVTTLVETSALPLS